MNINNFRITCINTKTRNNIIDSRFSKHNIEKLSVGNRELLNVCLSNIILGFCYIHNVGRLYLFALMDTPLYNRRDSLMVERPASQSVSYPFGPWPIQIKDLLIKLVNTASPLGARRSGKAWREKWWWWHDNQPVPSPLHRPSISTLQSLTRTTLRSLFE